MLWLATWMVHNANHLRESTDGLKVGGHQASSASLVTILSALYFRVLRPEDRVAVKPHASPAYHAIQYLFGKQIARDSSKTSAAMTAPSPILRGPRTPMMSTFPPDRSALASPRRSSPRSCRTMSARMAGARVAPRAA